VYGRAFGRKSAGYLNYKMTGPVTVAYRQGEDASGNKTEEFLDAGQNPPTGVIVHYTLGEEPEGEVKLEFLDAGGQVIRSFTSAEEEPPRVPKRAGANRFVWDLRYARPTKLDEPPSRDPMAQQQEAGAAPRALPGDYQVRLTVGDSALTAPFTILPDPRLGATADDLRAQFDLKLAIRDQLSAVHEAVNELHRLRKQVESWEGRAPDGDAGQRLKEAAAALKERLAALERELLVVEPDKPLPGPARLKEKLTTLSTMIDESDDPPTQGAREVFALLGSQVEARRAELRQLVAEEVGRFNELVRAAGIPPVGA
jgi:hypothetical protein